MGRFDQAIAENKLAQTLDPLSPETNTFLAVSLYFARRYDQAIEQLRNTLDLDPNYWFAHLYLGRAYEQKGELAKALGEFQKARQMGDVNPEPVAALGRAYALSGNRGEAEKILDELKQQSRQSYVPAYGIATIYAVLGEKDQTFTWLDKACEDRSFYLVWLRVDPQLDTLRSHPRFQALVRRVGLAT